MIYIHTGDNHPTSTDISMRNFTNSTPKKTFSSPIISNRFYSNEEEHISINNNKKIYTPQQIYDNVKAIRKQYEEIIENPISSPASCFSSFKQMTKLFKNLKVLPNKTIDQSRQINQIENKSPFIFGGETLQWIALPQYDDHIYENELIN